MRQPIKISICIPAYNRTGSLKRLLDSIAAQTFVNFEVIVSDDSPGNEVKELCDDYAGRFTLKYFHNKLALGTPENWNNAIRLAQGEWIKLMHDDDWLAGENSLREFADATEKHLQSAFFFCAYRKIAADNFPQAEVHIDSQRLKKIRNFPGVLVAGNVVGHPSVTLHRNDSAFFYDNNLKWLVDIEYYIRYFSATVPVFIAKPLVNIGVGEHQLTSNFFRDLHVEIPESFYLLNKIGVQILKHWMVYDAWWRLIRNLKIKRIKTFREAGYSRGIHPVIIAMVRWQRLIPSFILNTGVCSKIIMFLHYLLHLHLLTTAKPRESL